MIRKLSFILGILLTLWIPAITVSAQSQITLFPGQNGQFTVIYENKGDVSDVQNALLEVYLGDKLEIDPNSLTESFGGGTTYCVAPSTVTTDSSVAPWGTKITYRPRSATTTSAPCNGANTPGQANITAAPENPTPADKQGRLMFRARLKESVTDPAGTVLRPINNQGIYAEAKIGSTNVPSSFAIVVGQRTATNTTTTTTTTSTTQTGTTTTASNPTNNSSNLPRTGGFELILGVCGLAILVAGIVYAVTRPRKLKVRLK